MNTPPKAGSPLSSPASIHDLEARLTQEVLKEHITYAFKQLKEGATYQGPSGHHLYAAWREDNL